MDPGNAAWMNWWRRWRHQVHHELGEVVLSKMVASADLIDGHGVGDGVDSEIRGKFWGVRAELELLLF